MAPRARAARARVIQRCSGFLAFRFCAVSFSRRRSTAVSATRVAPAWGLGSSGPWPPATPHGQAPTPYLYKTPPKNIPDPKNTRVTDPKIPEVSAWRAMAGALRRGRSGPYALIFSGRGVRACPHEGPRDLLLLCLKPHRLFRFLAGDHYAKRKSITDDRRRADGFALAAGHLATEHK